MAPSTSLTSTSATSVAPTSSFRNTQTHLILVISIPLVISCVIALSLFCLHFYRKRQKRARNSRVNLDVDVHTDAASDDAMNAPLSPAKEPPCIAALAFTEKEMPITLPELRTSHSQSRFKDSNVCLTDQFIRLPEMRPTSPLVFPGHMCRSLVSSTTAHEILLDRVLSAPSPDATSMTSSFALLAAFASMDVEALSQSTLRFPRINLPPGTPELRESSQHHCSAVLRDFAPTAVPTPLMQDLLCQTTDKILEEMGCANEDAPNYVENLPSELDRFHQMTDSGLTSGSISVKRRSSMDNVASFGLGPQDHCLPAHLRSPSYGVINPEMNNATANCTADTEETSTDHLSSSELLASCCNDSGYASIGTCVLVTCLPIVPAQERPLVHAHCTAVSGSQPHDANSTRCSDLRMPDCHAPSNMSDACFPSITNRDPSPAESVFRGMRCSENGAKPLADDSPRTLGSPMSTSSHSTLSSMTLTTCYSPRSCGFSECSPETVPGTPIIKAVGPGRVSYIAQPFNPHVHIILSVS